MFDGSALGAGGAGSVGLMHGTWLDTGLGQVGRADWYRACILPVAETRQDGKISFAGLSRADDQDLFREVTKRVDSTSHFGVGPAFVAI